MKSLLRWIFRCLVVAVGLLAPAVVATHAEWLASPLFLLGGIPYGWLWVTVATDIHESVVHLYSVPSKPLELSRVPRWLRFMFISEPLPVPTLKEITLKALGSYGLTVYGFGLTYAFLSAVAPGSFNLPLTSFNAVYFSVVTAATVGFGDIVPISPVAKLLTVSEIVVSFAYVVFVFSLVTSGFSNAQPPDEPSR